MILDCERLNDLNVSKLYATLLSLSKWVRLPAGHNLRPPMRKNLQKPGGSLIPQRLTAQFADPAHRPCGVTPIESPI